MNPSITGMPEDNPRLLDGLLNLYRWILDDSERGKMLYSERLFLVAKEHYASCMECQMAYHAAGHDFKVEESNPDELDKQVRAALAKYPERLAGKTPIFRTHNSKLPKPSAVLNC